jgi:hypothetical protein
MAPAAPIANTLRETRIFTADPRVSEPLAGVDPRFHAPRSRHASLTPAPPGCDGRVRRLPMRPHLPGFAVVFALAVPPVLAGGCGEKQAPAPDAAAPPPTVAPAAAAAAPLPPGRTPVPSLSEYAAAREVTVKGSSALKCETKMIREWLRVTCRGKNDTGGTPTGVSVVRGGRGETIVFSAGGVTSIITPVLSGTDFEARFAWSDKSHPLTVRWPKGTPQPIVVGEFQGAASPLDRTAPSAALCECHQKVTHAKDCSEAPYAQPDCEHTFSQNCEKLLECARGEPGAQATCPAGKRNAGVTGWCAPLCGPGHAACVAGTECSPDWGEPPVCL